ncbi:hypothetical protein LTR53_016787 [Teratosphaeriaceae sp. CCFEE 6253]|nr:hypothetical protein LTR53_016787 [Teratosphaeriaceae sp. CCFEE 6253]
MALERVFARLRLQPNGVCARCRRSMASSTQPPHGQSATSAVAELLQASRAQNPTHPARRPTNAPAAAAVPSNPNAPSPYAIAEQTLRNSTTARQQRSAEQAQTEAARPWARRDLEQQIPRRFKPGDVYAPHDLSGVEMSKWKKLRRKPRVGSHGTDVLDSLGVDPRKHYKNFSMMAEYVSEMGRIKHRNETGLRPVSQRRMAKAIRRAIGTGLMPSVYRHPELLRDELRAKGPR